MTYDTEKVKAFKEPIILVQVDLDYCFRVFGVTPCTATATTPDGKCRNTWSTCQDRQNYGASFLEYKWSEINANVPASAGYIPCVHSVNVSPTVRKPSEGIPARGKVTIKLRDFPWHDRGIDKYANERSFSYEDRGTYFGRLLATNPFYENRPMKVRFGFVTDPWNETNFKDRAYIIDRFEGPDSKGMVTLVGKEPFESLDDIVFPEQTESVVTAGVNETATTIPVTNIQKFQDAFVAGSEVLFVAINDEIILVGSVNVAQNRLENCARGINFRTVSGVGSVHDTDDSVQICGNYAGQNCIDIAYDLIVSKGGRDSSLIPQSEWNSIRDKWFNGFDVGRIIGEPTPINELLADLMEQCGFDIYWQDIRQLYELKPVAPASSPNEFNDNDNFLKDSVKVRARHDKRISEIWYYYQKTDPLEADDPRYFARLVIFSSGSNANEYPEPKIRQIFGNWVESGQENVVNTVGGRYLSRLKNSPTEVHFRLEHKDSDLWVGDDFTFDSRTNQNVFGDNLRINCEVIQARQIKDEFEYVGLFTGLAATRLMVIAPNGSPTYENATQNQRDTLGFISGADGLMSDQTSGYAIQ